MVGVIYRGILSKYRWDKVRDLREFMPFAGSETSISVWQRHKVLWLRRDIAIHLCKCVNVRYVRTTYHDGPNLLFFDLI